MTAAELYHIRTKRYQSDLLPLIALSEGVHSAFEVGCGSGRVLSALKHVRRLCGIDRDPAMIDIARRELSSEGRTDVTLVLGDFLEYSSDERFDVVIFAFDVLAEFLDVTSRLRALQGAAKMLCPGGRVIVASTMHDFASWSREEVTYRFQLEASNHLDSPWSCTIHCRRDQVFQLSRCLVTYTSANPDVAEVQDRYVNALITRGEFLALYHAASLRLVAEFGSNTLDQLRPDSDRIVHILKAGAP